MVWDIWFTRSALFELLKNVSQCFVFKQQILWMNIAACFASLSCKMPVSYILYLPISGPTQIFCVRGIVLDVGEWGSDVMVTWGPRYYFEDWYLLNQEFFGFLGSNSKFV